MNATFWVISILMVLLGLGIILPSLIRKPNFGTEDLRAQNILIAKEKLSELEAELSSEKISTEIYQQRKQELELALLNDLENTNTELVEKQQSTNVAWVAGVAVPCLAVILYLTLGTAPELLNNPQQLTQSASANSVDEQHQQMSVQEMAAKLVAKLKQEPNNGEGWAMLGRTYMHMKDYANAAKALETANSLLPDNAGLMLRQADAIAMSADGRLAGKPITLITKALAIDPLNTTGLWLAGMHAEEQGDFKTAVKHWKNLYELVNGDAKTQQQVHKMLTRVNQQLPDNERIKLAAISTVSVAMPAPTAATRQASIQLTVSIEASVLAKVDANDTVFIYAKAMSGPPMPLAAVKKQVKDLPITLTLDDSMAMMPTMRLSSFKTVRVGARISKSGNAMPQAGDIKQELSNISTSNSTALTLVIGAKPAATVSQTSSKVNPQQPAPSATNSNNAIKLKVTLDAALTASVAADDVLFIYAKAMQEPPMPLAVVKRSVKDLPIYIALDDSMAMMPTMKLSNYKTVRVGARITKSGDPMPQDGDLFVEVGNVSTTHTEPVVLNINQVRGQVPAKSSKTPTKGLKIKVTLNPKLKTKTTPTDTVFIYAKAMQGPPMPLAVSKKQVSDLPITITLDDSMAMMPAMKLSKFKNVRVGARISKSGNAISQSGDLYNEISNISNSRTEQLSIDIDKIKP